jgi:dipeptidase D
MACKNFDTDRVFYYFNELCKIPHGSGNMDHIADFCVNFAKNHNLKYNRDSANNVIIYKPTENYPTDTIILQGHLDMVCQKDSDCYFDFLKDEITTFTDGDFLKANKTTLGADNGIAVAMIFAILENTDINLPSIEAVLTTDEEVGMLGAMALDTSLLKGKKMINIDSEDDEVLTVSCAGGSDFSAILPIEHETKTATEITVTLQGLKGGHSGVEIDKKRVNANILAGRFLNYMKSRCDFDIISICGGDKSNAIANACTIRLCSTKADEFVSLSHEYLNVIKNEISARERRFNPLVTLGAQNEFKIISSQNKNDIIGILATTPNGIIEMSAEIEDLVETSLNLGILVFDKDAIRLQFALRSNKQSALDALEEKLSAFFERYPCETKIGGKYPTWEFKENSAMQKIYSDIYLENTGKKPKVEAIHAGLECAVFSSTIKDLDCIAIGPTIFDAHTTNERLSLSSTHKIFNILTDVLTTPV